MNDTHIRTFAKQLLEDGWAPILGGMWFKNSRRPGASIGGTFHPNGKLARRETMVRLRAELQKWDDEDHEAAKLAEVQA